MMIKEGGCGDVGTESRRPGRVACAKRKKPFL